MDELEAALFPIGSAVEFRAWPWAGRTAVVGGYQDGYALVSNAKTGRKLTVRAGPPLTPPAQVPQSSKRGHMWTKRSG